MSNEEARSASHNLLREAWKATRDYFQKRSIRREIAGILLDVDRRFDGRVVDRVAEFTARRVQALRMEDEEKREQRLKELQQDHGEAILLSRPRVAFEGDDGTTNALQKVEWEAITNLAEAYPQLHSPKRGDRTRMEQVVTLLTSASEKEMNTPGDLQ